MFISLKSTGKANVWQRYVRQISPSREPRLRQHSALTLDQVLVLTILHVVAADAVLTLNSGSGVL